MPETDRIPIQFDITPEVYKGFEDLRDTLNYQTTGEVVSTGLEFLRLIFSAHKNGEKIFTEDKDGRMSEVRFPFLEPKASTEA
jgi:hypothetical protein